MKLPFNLSQEEYYKLKQSDRIEYLLFSNSTLNRHPNHTSLIFFMIKDFLFMCMFVSLLISQFLILMSIYENWIPTITNSTLIIFQLLDIYSKVVIIMSIIFVILTIVNYNIRKKKFEVFMKNLNKVERGLKQKNGNIKSKK